MAENSDEWFKVRWKFLITLHCFFKLVQIVIHIGFIVVTSSFVSKELPSKEVFLVGLNSMILLLHCSVLVIGVFLNNKKALITYESFLGVAILALYFVILYTLFTTLKVEHALKAAKTSFFSSTSPSPLKIAEEHQSKVIQHISLAPVFVILIQICIIFTKMFSKKMVRNRNERCSNIVVELSTISSRDWNQNNLRHNPNLFRLSPFVTTQTNHNYFVREISNLEINNDIPVRFQTTFCLNDPPPSYDEIMRTQFDVNQVQKNRGGKGN